jgi:hypothetical protein
MNKHPAANYSHLVFTECKAQTSSMAYSNKMIKEDHLLACTTRMSEIFVRLSDPPPGKPGGKTARRLGFRPNNPVQSGLSDTHPRGFRLFTCQRASLIRRLTISGSSDVVHPARFGGRGILS